MQLFYHPHIEQEFLHLEKEESRHLIQVLRKGVGDEVHFTNGKGSLFSMVVEEAHPKKAVLRILEKTYQEPPAAKLSIAIAPTKNMDRLEWFLEKSTEIGVHAIYPMLCDHSERKVVKPERLEKILVSAMKQSLAVYKPVLFPLTSFKEVVDMSFEGSRMMAHLENENTPLLGANLKPGQSALILIGPEGDFSPNEIDKARGTFDLVSLGSKRLRTETAGVVACSQFNLIQSLNN